MWLLNLFNFVDGIDGIAGSEAVFLGVAGAGVACLGGLAGSAAAAGVLVAAASLGFLAWNWPPARIFMGDVGSGGYLGFPSAIIALAAGRDHAAMVYVWLILMGLFLVDATVTLVRRLARGQRVHQAHRDHAYQHLARRWGSHRRVTVVVVLVNVLWLLPWALFAIARPAHAGWVAVFSLAPLVLVAVVAGAGRREQIPGS